MKRLRIIEVLMVAAMMGTFGVSLAAEKIDIGKGEYEAHCAICHGPKGKGDGPFAEIMLKSRVADLTVLSMNNKGVFPFIWVYEVIDGRQQVKAHGTREMPIWGNVYAAKGAPNYDDYPYDTESFVRGRILALIDYLNRLQAK
jgi:mono/diheme cytochrome c family protein